VDILSIIGIVLSLVAVIGGNMLEGGHSGSLVQLTALVIVLGGTFGAIFVQTPLPVFIRATQLAKWVFVPPKLGMDETIGKISNWSKMARREGLLSLQKVAAKQQDPFVQKALMMLVDGSEPEDIRKVMEVDIFSHASFDASAARVFEGMGGYSPTIGIIGAVLGLIHVMNNLADPNLLGPGIAVAFVATIYGVGFANFLFLPMANKLKSIVDHYVQYREMVVEGIVSIAEGENPRIIEHKLKSYIA
jgi:chemotaxis protein MotA